MASHSTRLDVRTFGWLSGVLAVCGLPSLAWADSVFVRSTGGGAPLELPNVRILRIEGGRLFFRTTAGETSREVGQIYRIALDDEPALTRAEAAFVGGQFDAATDDYLRVARSSARPWVRQWASLRLLTAAERAGRFDAAVAAYVQLVQTDPALAQANRPVVDPASPPRAGLLDAAVAELDRALAPGRTLTADQRRALLQLKLELHRARGDTARTARTLEELLPLGGTPPGGAATGGAGAGTETPAEALADLRLAAATVALDAGDHRRALETLQQSRGLFTVPRQQSQALFLLARAADLASAGGDRPARQDAALAYLRVVAHFRGVPGADRQVPAAALRAAEILEELGQADEARGLYRDVAEGRLNPVDAPADAAAVAAARKAIERLR